MKTPGVAPPPGTTFGREVGHNAAQIRRSDGFILARKRDRCSMPHEKGIQYCYRAPFIIAPVPNKISEHRAVKDILSMPIDTRKAAQQQAITGHRVLHGFAPSALTPVSFMRTSILLRPKT